MNAIALPYYKRSAWATDTASRIVYCDSEYMSGQLHASATLSSITPVIDKSKRQG